MSRNLWSPLVTNYHQTALHSAELYWSAVSVAVLVAELVARPLRKVLFSTLPQYSTVLYCTALYCKLQYSGLSSTSPASRHSSLRLSALLGQICISLHCSHQCSAPPCQAGKSHSEPYLCRPCTAGVAKFYFLLQECSLVATRPFVTVTDVFK